MLLFLDTAELGEIEKYNQIIDGVTTTPTIIKRAGISGEDFMVNVRRTFPDLEVHFEALAPNSQSTINLIHEYISRPWYDSERVVFKVPISVEGIKVVRQLKKTDRKVKVNLHMIFSVAQASLAMTAKPQYITPLVGRHADKIAEMNSHGKRIHGKDAGYDLLNSIVLSKKAVGCDTKILASSIRTVHDFTDACILGADAVTLPPDILRLSLEHSMTTEGVEQFKKDLA